MKLNIDYIQKILVALHDSTEPRISLLEIMSAIGDDRKNETDRKFFYYHISRMDEMCLIDCDYDGEGKTHLGFVVYGKSIHIDYNHGAFFELTFEGHQFLEALQKDPWKEKVTALLKEMSIEQIKTRLPALLIQIITGGGGG